MSRTAMSEEHNADETAENEFPNGVSRRSVLQKIGGASSVAIGGYTVSGTAAAQTRGSLPNDLSIDTLKGKKRTDVLNRALQEERMSAFVEEFSERDWHTSDEQKKAYEITSNEQNIKYTAVTIDFSTGDSSEAYITWNSTDKFDPFAQRVENAGSDELHVTTFQYDEGSGVVTTTEETVQEGGSGITPQHHGPCGLNKSINYTCLAKNAGAIAGGAYLCSACVYPFPAIGTDACRTCVAGLLGAGGVLQGIDCNICS